MFLTIFLFCLIVALAAFIFAGALSTQESAEGAIVCVTLIRLGLWLIVIAFLVPVFTTLIKIGVIHPF